jgi:hypothetical protein
VGFDVNDILQFKFFAFFRYWRKKDITLRQLTYFKKTSDPVRREVFF